MAAPELIHKALPTYGITSIDEAEGIVEAYVSGIGNKDSVNDIIESGAFDASLKVRKPKGVWSHNWDQPVSKTLEIYEVKAGSAELPMKMKSAGIGGLFVKTQFNLDTQAGRDAFSWVKFYGDESEWSIGYQVSESEFDPKAKAMRLKAIDLFEYSPVLFGANPLTSTVGVKTIIDNEGNESVVVKVEGASDTMSKKIEAAVKAAVADEAANAESLEDAVKAVDANVDEIVETLVKEEEESDTKEGDAVDGDAEGVEVTADDAVEGKTAEVVEGADDAAVEGEAEVPAGEKSADADVDPADEGAEATKGADDSEAEVKPAEVSQAVEFAKGILGAAELSVADAEHLKDYVDTRVSADDEKIMVGSWAYISKMVRKALKAQYERYVYIHSIFDSKVVYEIYTGDDDGYSYYEASYTIADGVVTLGDAVEVDVVEVVVAKNAVIEAAFKGHGPEVKSLLKPFVDLAENAEVLDETHQKALTEALEVKVGATLSKANKATLETAISELKSAMDAIEGLLGTKDDADDDDTETKDAEVAPVVKDAEAADAEVKTGEAVEADEASQEADENGMVTIDPDEFAEMKSLLGL